MRLTVRVSPSSFTPPQKGAGQMLEGNDMATCEKLAGILLEKHII